VPDYCTCGARLPEDARFCHKCGKPQFEEVAEPELQPEAPVTPPPLPALEISFRNGTAVRISFVAALLAIVLSVVPLPFPPLRYALAFLVLPASGFIAVYIYMRRTGQRLTLRSGARLGWITGIFLFTISIVQLTGSMVLLTASGDIARQVRDVSGGDAGYRELQKLLNQPADIAITVCIAVILLLFIFLTALPMLGGALGAKVLEKTNA
jgi:hypothetical protein